MRVYYSSKLTLNIVLIVSGFIYSMKRLKVFRNVVKDRKLNIKKIKRF